MIVTKIIRLLRGYVLFSAFGGFNERLVNLCVESGITLWDVCVNGGVVHAYTYASDYFKLRHAARAAGARIKICQKRGLGFFIKRHRQRIGFPVGAFVFILLIYLLSTMIWTVSIEGNVRLYEDDMVRLLSSLGVSPGVFKSHIDTDDVEQQLTVLLEDSVYWTSLNIEGSCAKLEIRELPGIKLKQSLGSPCNVVADFDGVIVGMSVLGGKAGVKTGSAVRRGDLLISGVIENKDATTSLYEAMGEAVAMHTREFSIDIYGRDIECLLTDETVYRVGFFGLELPLGGRTEDGESFFCRELRLNIGGVELPAGLSKIYRLSTQPVQLDEERLSLIALSEFFMERNQKFKNTAVISQSVVREGDKISFNARCLDYIGVQKEIITQENTDISQ